MLNKFFKSKYEWSLRKYWINWFKRDVKKWWYSKIYKLNVGGIDGSLIPSTGKNKFVSVKSKCEIIQIKGEQGYLEHLICDEIRIIPYKENLGVAIERFKDGEILDRNFIDLNQFNKDRIFANSNKESKG